eukprot:13629620-Alexandrium_andersonii.AAC.1
MGGPKHLVLSLLAVVHHDHSVRRPFFAVVHNKPAFFLNLAVRWAGWEAALRVLLRLGAVELAAVAEAVNKWSQVAKA